MQKVRGHNRALLGPGRRPARARSDAPSNTPPVSGPEGELRMRIRAIYAKDLTPIQRFEVEDLSDTVVFAGPNGVGKTNLVPGIIGFFRNPRPGQPIRLIVEPTRNLERKEWGDRFLDTSVADDCALLHARLQKTQRRNNYRSTVLNFESDRRIENIKPFAFYFDIDDPYEEEVSWDLSFGYLRSRSQDTQNTTFRRVDAQRKKKSRHGP